MENKSINLNELLKIVHELKEFPVEVVRLAVDLYGRGYTCGDVPEREEPVFQSSLTLSMRAKVADIVKEVNVQIDDNIRSRFDPRIIVSQSIKNQIRNEIINQLIKTYNCYE